MANRINMVGNKYGRLTVTKYSHRDKHYNLYWFVDCDCGIVGHVVLGDHIRRSRIKSCGCLKKETSTKHGMYGTRTYVSWGKMIQRCTNNNNDWYHRYGGRGITICSAWLNFKEFHADMGDRPEGKSIDRINNDGNYEPGNCRWATPSEQNFNRGGMGDD